LGLLENPGVIVVASIDKLPLFEKEFPKEFEKKFEPKKSSFGFFSNLFKKKK